VAGKISFPPVWILPTLAAVILSLSAAIEIQLAYNERVADVWQFHVLISATVGFWLTFPLAYQIYKFRRIAQKEINESRRSLRRTTEYLISTSDSVPFGIITLDKSRKIIFQNKRHKEWFGEGMNKRCEDLFMGRYRCDACLIDEVFKTGKSVTKRVTIGERSYEIASSLFIVPRGATLVMEVFSDITDLEQTRRRLTDMETTISRTDKLATLGQLAAGVAHEINTPLANISLIAESIEKHSASEEEKKKLAIIRGQVDSAAKTVRDLLSYIRADISEAEKVDLNALIEETIWFVSQKRHAKITITTELSPPAPKVLGSKSQLQQVFVNIISNAYDAMREAGNMTVTTGVQGSDVFISVRDTGKGITPEEMKRLFQPFYTTKKGTGTGLGLTIARDIVERHRGRIKVESEPGQGATFTIFIPATP